MKGRWIALVMAAMMAVTMVGCGSSAESAAETEPAEAAAEEASEEAEAAEEPETTPEEEPEELVEPLDLTGLWKSEDRDGSTFVGEIREDGKIGVFLLAEGDETPWTYWVGTYTAPETDDEEYSWVSKNTYAGDGLLASTAEEKEFRYKDGVLTFTITIQDESGDVDMTRGDWDTSIVPEDAYAEGLTQEETDAAVSGEVLQVVDSSWYLKNGEWLCYYIKIHNASEDTAVDLPSYRVTARDKDNVLLGSYDHTLGMIYPGQDYEFTSQAFSVEDVPESVEFEILPPEDYNLKKASTLPEYKPLEVVNTAFRTDKFVGEINNPNDYDLSSAYVGVVGKDADGNIMVMEMTFVDSVPANGSAPFEIPIWLMDGSVDQIVDYQVFANPWM